jgi:hypothetical protein
MVSANRYLYTNPVTARECIPLPGPADDFIGPSGASANVLKLLYHGIEPNTRKSYRPGVKSWESFTQIRGLTSYPASLPTLIEWVAAKFFGNSSDGMAVVTAQTLRKYLTAIRSRHVDMALSVSIFTHPSLNRMLSGATSLNPVLF